MTKNYAPEVDLLAHFTVWTDALDHVQADMDTGRSSLPIPKHVPSAQQEVLHSTTHAELQCLMNYQTSPRFPSAKSAASASCATAKSVSSFPANQQCLIGKSIGNAGEKLTIHSSRLAKLPIAALKGQSLALIPSMSDGVLSRAPN